MPRNPEFTRGDRMAKARCAAGIGVAAMGDMLGYTRNTIYNWESNRTVPARAILISWSVVCDVDLWWLLGDEPNHQDTRRGTRGQGSATTRA